MQGKKSNYVEATVERLHVRDHANRPSVRAIPRRGTGYVVQPQAFELSQLRSQISGTRNNTLFEFLTHRKCEHNKMMVLLFHKVGGTCELLY